GEVCLDEVRFSHTAGGALTYEYFQAGQLDVAVLSEAEPGTTARDAGVQNLTQDYFGYGIVMNIARGDGSSPTADPRVREAVMRAINEDAIDERVWGGLGAPGRALIDGDGAPASDVVPYDLDRAKALVEAAKADGWDGRLRMVVTDVP